MKTPSSPLAPRLLFWLGALFSLLPAAAPALDPPPASLGAVPTVTLRQKSATTSIGLGANDIAGRLDLTDAELDFITAAKLTIGDTLTPALTLSAPLSRTAATTLTLIANPATGTIVPSGPGTDLDLGPGGALTIGGPGAGLGFGIAGLTADTQYAQMKVLGTVNLNSARLVLSSSLAAPAAGNAFTLVDNDGTDAITGTFAGVAQSALVPWPGSSTLVGRVVYNGGPATMSSSPSRPAPSPASPHGPTPTSQPRPSSRPT